MTIINNFNSDLDLINNLIFKTCGLAFSNFEPELESQEYVASSFRLDNQNVKFRIAKITPKKIGQFVTIWKRNGNKLTEPFNTSDDIDFFIIATRKKDQFGLFIFPKAVLYEKRILSGKDENGKRGIRVYPSWDITINKQAQNTQKWQNEYFIEISDYKSIDIKRVKRFFKIPS